jgi:hypothetical protein
MSTGQLTATDLERLMAEAVDALQGPSPVLEKAPKMSKKELTRSIDERLDQITSGTMTGASLEQAKVEAQLLAIMRLRRG